MVEPWLRICQSLAVGQSKRVRCCGGDASAIARNEQTQWSWWCYRCKVFKAEQKEFVSLSPVTQERWVPSVPDDLQPLGLDGTAFLLSKGLWPSLCSFPMYQSASAHRLVFDVGNGVMLGRSTDSRVMPKWVQYGGTSNIRHVGLVRPVTFVTEDLLSMLKMQAALPKHVGVVTSLGTTIPRELGTLLKTRCHKQLIVAYDGDAAGQSGAARVVRAFKPYMPVIAACSPEGRDPKALQIREIQEMYGHYCS